MRRRSRAPIPASGLSLNDFSRIGALLVLLALVATASMKARDPHLWAWLAPEKSEPSTPIANQAYKRTVSPVPVEADEDLNRIPPPAQDELLPLAGPPSQKPIDTDPAEWEDAQREFEILSDKSEYTAPEMFSYWRLFRWELSQSDAQLRNRAKNGVTFRDLFTSPDQFRGKLIRLQLRFAQAIESNLKPSENLLELPIERIYEVQGWNEESQPYCFSLVTSQLPRGMHTGVKLSDAGEFIGYFHKLVPFEDHLGKTRAAPVLIGRILALAPRPQPVESSNVQPYWFWGTAVVFLVYLAVRYGPLLFSRSQPISRRTRPKLNEAGEELPSVGDWLDQASGKSVSGDDSPS